MRLRLPLKTKKKLPIVEDQSPLKTKENLEEYLQSAISFLQTQQEAITFNNIHSGTSGKTRPIYEGGYYKKSHQGTGS